MQYTKINDLKKNWSNITFGCWQIAPSIGWGDRCTPSEADAVVKAALDSGITAFDTAEGYGDGESERRLGNALGSKKDDAIIISKIWPDAELTLPAFQERLDNTLLALKRDYVDVYLVHWPGDYYDTEEKSAQLCDYMAALKESGKARLIGLSNFKQEDLLRLGNAIDQFSINQIPYSMLRREYESDDISTTCKKHGLQYMAYGPTAKGLLARRLTDKDLQCNAREENELFQSPLYEEAQKVFSEVQKIANELNVSPVQVALAWTVAQNNILTAIVGSKKAEQITEAAKQITLSDDQLEQLSTVSEDFMKFKLFAQA